MRPAQPFLIAVLVAGGCQSVPREGPTAPAPASSAAPSPVVVRGTAAYLERIVVPGAQLEVIVVDDAAADAPAPADATVARARFDDLHGPPYAFALQLDPARLRADAHYSLRVTLRDGRGYLAFMTPARVAVDPDQPVDLRLVRTPSQR